MGEIFLPPAFRLIAKDCVDSTNDVARSLAEGGAEDGTLVWAREQTAGRGRRGRSWASPPGNLYLSLILRPDVPMAQAAQLSFAAALAVGGAVGSLVPPLTALNYKWPNDVLLNGRKVSGLLLEAGPPDTASDTVEGPVPQFLILGLGLNIASAPSETRYPATTLWQEGAGDATVEGALDGFCRHLLVWVNRWLTDGFAPLRSAWWRSAHGAGEQVELSTGAEVFRGRFAAIDPEGRLVLAGDDGVERTFAAGDVSFAMTSAAGGGARTDHRVD